MTTDISARYEKAQTLVQGFMTNRLVMNDAVFPHWIAGSSSFWYMKTTRDGKQYRLVDAKAATNVAAFDHQALADALTKSTGKAVASENLPFFDITVTLSPTQVRFRLFARQWLFTPGPNTLQEKEAVQEGLPSPDGKKLAFVREHNIWIRDQATGKDRALTTDGAEDFSYGRAMMAHLVDQPLEASWSPDSRHLFVAQLDIRKVANRPFVHYVPQDGSLHPQLKLEKRAYPGDEHVESSRLVVIDIETGQLKEPDCGQLPLSGWGFGFFSWIPLGWWSKDNRRAFFVDVERGSKAARIVEWDTQTGATKALFEETSDTYLSLAHGAEEMLQFLPLPETDELIWFSERSGWAHLYLYDLNTGKLKSTVTKGEWLVREVLHYDAKRRELLVQTGGRDPGVNTYYRDVCKVNIDSGKLTPVISGPFDHAVYRPGSTQSVGRRLLAVDSARIDGVSHDGEFLVTTRSRVDTAPESVLIDRKGRELLSVEKADTSNLPKGWRWPEPVKLKGADNKTDIYGVVYRPTDFSPDKRYPVLDCSGGYRGYDSVPYGSFINSSMYGLAYLLGHALAELGFVVVAVDGRGTPYRDRAFKEYGYGDLASPGNFNDRIAAIRQLAERYPYMDLDRVGITAMDALANTTYALLNHPEFYKVGTLFCFHEYRFSWAYMGERYDGISVGNLPHPKTRHAEDNVEALKGKLLLTQGMLDYSTPASTFRLVEALQKANKDFDMMCFPNVGLDIPTYALRMSWDYLVRHVQGIEPPKEFPLTTGLDLVMAASAAANQIAHTPIKDASEK